MPVLAVYGSYYPAFGGNVTINPALDSMKALVQNVRGIQIPNLGHWGPEERPDFVIRMLDNFFVNNSSSTTKTNKYILSNTLLSSSVKIAA